MDRILFFDGECGLCNWFVNFCLEHDAEGRICYSSLQSEYAASEIPEEVKIQMDRQGGSVVYWKGGRYFLRSEAVFEIARDLKGLVPRLLFPLRFLPRNLLDRVYIWVAKNRYKFFGKVSHCRFVPLGKREKFLELKVDKILPSVSKDS